MVLATGGIGRLYANTTNPPEVTGDGLAMAARAGALLADLEFVQFHPTALASGRDPMALLTEALRGEGAVLVDETGERFMVGQHPDAELAPRDVVARAIWARLQAGSRVYLDATTAVGAVFPERFPTVFDLCLEDGIDPRVQPVPVAPAAHYHMGGVATALDGRTSLPGLWAVGEVSRTGVHGANRLASNSLLEATVFGQRAGEAVRAADARAGGGDRRFRRCGPGAGSRRPERIGGRVAPHHVGRGGGGARRAGPDRGAGAPGGPGRPPRAGGFGGPQHGGRRPPDRSGRAGPHREPRGALPLGLSRARPGLGGPGGGGGVNDFRPLPPLLYEPVVEAALREDLGRAGDITTDAVVPADATATAQLVARREGEWPASRSPAAPSPCSTRGCRWSSGRPTATTWPPGRSLAVVSGPARAILSAERVALNLLGRLCGIATQTRRVVALVAGTGARVACTRKTTPGLRALEKYAVRVGGGSNHRFGLDDAVLIKDNHVAVAGGVGEAVRRAKAAVGHLVKVEVEVTSLAQVQEALDAGAEVILLDNMTPEQMREAVALVAGRAVTEASGGITPDNAAEIAATGVDVLSLGWLTHSVPALDVALDVVVG